MNILTDTFTQLFGQQATLGNIIASGIMYLIGAATVFFIEVSHRDKASERTPEKFNLLFLFKDNQTRIVLTLLIGLIVLVAGSNITYLIGVQVPETVGRFLPLIAGLSSDMISLSLKRKFSNESNG